MPKYAAFNSAISGPTFSGWYDTDLFTYASLPPPADMLELTTAEWDAHFANPNGWAVQSGALVTYTPPAPVLPLAQQAAAAINAGLTITLSGSLTLAATLFPTDPVTTAKIGAVITTLLATGAFPGGTTSYPMKDATGAWHTFTAAQYPKVAGALAAYVAALDLIADGNPLGATELPANSATVALS